MYVSSVGSAAAGDALLVVVVVVVVVRSVMVVARELREALVDKQVSKRVLYPTQLRRILCRDATESPAARAGHIYLLWL